MSGRNRKQVNLTNIFSRLPLEIIAIIISYAPFPCRAGNKLFLLLAERFILSVISRKSMYRMLENEHLFLLATIFKYTNVKNPEFLIRDVMTHTSESFFKKRMGICLSLIPSLSAEAQSYIVNQACHAEYGRKCMEVFIKSPLFQRVNIDRNILQWSLTSVKPGYLKMVLDTTSLDLSQYLDEMYDWVGSYYLDEVLLNHPRAGVPSRHTVIHRIARSEDSLDLFLPVMKDFFVTREEALTFFGGTLYHLLTRYQKHIGFAIDYEFLVLVMESNYSTNVVLEILNWVDITGKSGELLEIAMELRNRDYVEHILNTDGCSATIDQIKRWLSLHERISCITPRMLVSELLFPRTDFDWSADNNAILKHVVSLRDVSLLSKILEEKFTRGADPDEIFALALETDRNSYRQGMVRAVFGYMKPRKIESLLSAISKDMPLTVEKLLETIDPSQNESQALVLAVEKNNKDMVKLLLSDGRADPSIKNNMLLKIASGPEYEDVRMALLGDHRIVLTKSHRKRIPK